MSWADIRKKARRDVHSTFRLPAVYSSPDGLVVTPCFARMHNEMKTFGDLDREQFAQIIDDVNHVIFDGLEVDPKKDGIIDFGGKAKFIIVNVLPKTTDEFYRVEVTLA